MPATIAQETLIRAWFDGKLSRRAFIARASMLGLSAGAIGAWIDKRGATAQEAPTPTPIVATHGGADAAVKITYWTILNGPDGDEMNALVGKFAAENPDIQVESIQGLTDYIPKMQAAAISGTLPDVTLLRHHYIGTFGANNILSPLQASELEQAGIRAEDYDPTVWQFTKSGDTQYTVPLDIHCFAQIYNKTAITNAGLTVPTTWDEVKAVAQATTNQDTDTVGYMHWILNNANSADPFTWLWFNFQHQLGGSFISEDGSAAAFNTPEGVAALTLMKELEDIGNPEHLPYFDLNRNGNVISWPDGPWIISAMFNPEQAPAAADLEVATLPQHDAAAPAVWAQSHQLALPTQSNQDEARREASLKFVNWLTQNAVEWSRAGQVPAHNVTREQALAVTELPQSKLKAWADQLAYAKFMPTNVPTLLEVLPRLGSHVQAALLGQASIEDALNDAEAEVNDILAGA